MTTYPMSRRRFGIALAALAGTAVAGCGRAAETQAKPTEDSPTPSAGQATPMTVYRDPSCGCCEAWAGIARKAGFAVTVVDRPDMAAVKRQYGVPDALRSCHTAVVAGYAIEGHVPLAHVERLLATRPANLRGIAVAGMPRGSPGMEMPDGSADPFEVIAFDEAGLTARFDA